MIAKRAVFNTADGSILFEAEFCSLIKRVELSDFDWITLIQFGDSTPDPETNDFALLYKQPGGLPIDRALVIKNTGPHIHDYLIDLMRLMKDGATAVETGMALDEMERLDEIEKQV